VIETTQALTPQTLDRKVSLSGSSNGTLIAFERKNKNLLNC